MQSIVATYKVVTPLFLSGLDQARAELREPSFKGAMRFWFRAIALPRLADWQAVKEEEQRIFGSTDTGQGLFLLNIGKNKKVETVTLDWSSKWGKELYGIDYLSYGIISDKKPQREYIKQGELIRVKIVFRPKTSEKDMETVKLTLIALGLMGGIGARSRHGFGSLALESLEMNGQEEWNAPRDREQLLCYLKALVYELKITSEVLPPYTAFSRTTHIIVSSEESNEMQLLDHIGCEMIKYRSYGRLRGGKYRLPWGEPAEPNFQEDHHSIYNFAYNRIPVSSHPSRAVFGLPYNYFIKRNQNRPNDAKVQVNGI
ncbi:MAG: type III-B CRISPR module RAMP protein Cmr1, partial [Firmicutes bacterium]|nr:type III-B CRISPR module RAMP protein Cmr1 [Bacillota bacterium]